MAPGNKGSRLLGLTTLPPSVSRMSENVGTSSSHSPKGLDGLYRDNFTFYLVSKWTAYIFVVYFTQLSVAIRYSVEW
jgi:hypothetical protein